MNLFFEKFVSVHYAQYNELKICSQSVSGWDSVLGDRLRDVERSRCLYERGAVHAMDRATISNLRSVTNRINKFHLVDAEFNFVKKKSKTALFFITKYTSFP